MLTKAAILQYYDSFFKRYPEKTSIAGVIDSLQRYYVSQKLSCRDSEYKGIAISKEYLLMEQMDEWGDLPEYLSVQELKALNEQHGDQLCWRLLDSAVTDEQICDYQQRWHIHLPKEFEVFLKSYANLLCEIEIPSVEEDALPIRLELPLMLWNNEMNDFNIDIDIEEAQFLSDFGYILIATQGGYEWWCLDTQNGKMVAYTDDDDYSDLDDSCDKEELFDKHGVVCFESFSDFLKVIFGENRS